MTNPAQEFQQISAINY